MLPINAELLSQALRDGRRENRNGNLPPCVEDGDKHTSLSKHQLCSRKEIDSAGRTEDNARLGQPSSENSFLTAILSRDENDTSALSQELWKMHSSQPKRLCCPRGFKKSQPMRTSFSLRGEVQLPSLPIPRL